MNNRKTVYDFYITLYLLYFKFECIKYYLHNDISSIMEGDFDIDDPSDWPNDFQELKVFLLFSLCFF